MNIKSNISTWSINHANTLIHFIQNTSEAFLLILPFIIVVAWMVGKKLRTFAKPENSKSSRVIRDAGSMLNILGLTMGTLFLVYSLIILGLVFIGLSFGEHSQGYSSADLVALSAVKIWSVAYTPLVLIIAGSAAGLLFSLYLSYYQIPEWERGEGLHDTKKLVKQFKNFKKFNPLTYVDIQLGCFVGLDSKRNPIYAPWQKIRETHISVLGATASGKGIILSLISFQCILAKESVVFIDPKFDRYSPRTLNLAAKKAGKNFHFINLNPDQVPQINPIAGAAAHEIEELLVSGFDLKGTGTDGDFHRGRDEDAAIQASRIAIEKCVRSIPELVKVCASIESITSQENFWRKLLKLADLAPLATNHGLDLAKAIKNGDVIYIVGSVDNERVKMLQKMLVVRITQIIKSQDRFAKHQKICLVMDEFKHLLSPIALTGLGVIRDFDTHCLLAFQSMGDLNSCPSISREEAEGVVKDNTAIKIIYKISDAKYAEELSLNSGKRPVFTEQASKNIDDDGHAKGGWHETHVPIIASDLITNLPMPSDRENQASTGILFGVGVAQLFHVSPIPVSGDMPKPNAAEKIDDQAVFQVDEVI